MSSCLVRQSWDPKPTGNLTTRVRDFFQILCSLGSITSLPNTLMGTKLGSSDRNNLLAINSDSSIEWQKYGSPPLTKIVATIGPASQDKETLGSAVLAGMRIMRINFSHATPASAEELVRRLRAAPGWHAQTSSGNFNTRAIMLDTKGPEIRTGELRVVRESGDSSKMVLLEKGNIVKIVTDPKSKGDSIF